VKFILDETILNYDITNPHQKKQCLDELLSFLKTLDSIIAYEYKPYLSNKLNIQPQHIRLDNHQRKRQNDISLTTKDIAELSVIKTALSSDSMFDIVANSLNKNMFNTHKLEFDAMFDDKQNSKLIQIGMTQDINILTPAELGFQISMMTIKYYKSQLTQTKHDNSMPFDEKVKNIKQLQQNIKQLSKNTQAI
jgi:hypothetical protein